MKGRLDSGAGPFLLGECCYSLVICPRVHWKAQRKAKAFSYIFSEMTLAPHYTTSLAYFRRKAPKTAGDVIPRASRVTSPGKNGIKAARSRASRRQSPWGTCPPPGTGRGTGPAGDKFSRSEDAGNGGRGRSAAASERGERSSPRGSASGFCDKRAKCKKGGRQVPAGLAIEDRPIVRRGWSKHQCEVLQPS